MASTKQARNRATANFIKNHTRRWVMRCHNEYDADIIEYLEAYDGGINALLKELVRDRMRSEGIPVNKGR